jgi:hypothetical protein
LQPVATLSASAAASGGGTFKFSFFGETASSDTPAGSTISNAFQPKTNKHEPVVANSSKSSLIGAKEAPIGKAGTPVIKNKCVFMRSATDQELRVCALPLSLSSFYESILTGLCSVFVVAAASACDSRL